MIISLYLRKEEGIDYSKIKLEEEKKINELSQKIVSVQKDIKIKESQIDNLIIEKKKLINKNKLLVEEKNKNQ